jgi:hypothetical protein
MIVLRSEMWKLALAIALVALIFGGAFARAPKRTVPGRDLRLMVLAALALYAVGALASFTRHPALAAGVYAAGIAVCALAAWLSRGAEPDDPPGGPDDEEDDPPRGPDGSPELDWSEFERAFRAYAQREGQKRAFASGGQPR